MSKKKKEYVPTDEDTAHPWTISDRPETNITTVFVDSDLLRAPVFFGQ